MTFTIIKKGNNNFWHLFNNGAKEINLSDFQAVLDSVAQTFIIQALNGANIPQTAVGILDIIVIDETDASLEETFANVEALRTRLVELGYTPYLGAVADNITGLIEAGTNVTITGDGTTGSPYVISSSGGGGGSVTSVNSDTGAVIVDLQSAVEQGRIFTESDGTTQYDFETFTGSGTGKRFIARVTTLATSLVNILSFGRNYLQAKIVTSTTASKEFIMDLTNCYWENLNSSGYKRLRIPTRSVSGNSIFDLPNNRIRSSYNLAIEKERVISSTRTAENYTEYIVDKQTAGACVFTDPSTSQVGYTVFVFKGSAELGGVEFFEGSYIQRYYDSVSATWINIDLKTTIDATPTDGSSNAVSSNGVFDALATNFEKAIIKENYFWATPSAISNSSTFGYSTNSVGQPFLLSGSALGSKGMTLFNTTAVAGTIAFKRRNDAWVFTNFIMSFKQKIQFQTNISGQRFFHGLTKNNQFTAPTNVDQTTLTNIVGVCQLSTSTNMHVIHNDSSGTATTIDLGSNYPCNDTQYNYFITIEQNASNYVVTVERVTVATGASISTTNTLSTNIMDYTTGVIQICTWITNNATASIASYLDGGLIGKFNN